jgi:hypothetical protein
MVVGISTGEPISLPDPYLRTARVRRAAAARTTDATPLGEVSINTITMRIEDIFTTIDLSEAKQTWQKHKNPRAGGMSKKAVRSYRRSNPGSKIQTAVTTKPSKLKKGSKSSKRRLSFCRRMRGMKKKRTSAKTARDPNSAINKSLRRWNCESVQDMRELVMIAEQRILALRENRAVAQQIADAEKYQKKQGVREGSDKPKPMVCKNCGKRQGEHRRDECPKGRKTAIGYTDYGPGKFEPKQKKSVAEGADIQRKVFKKNGEPVGEVGMDLDASPGQGDWYIKHYASGTDLSGYDSYTEAVEELKHLVKQGVSEAGYNPLDDERREQRRMDQERAQFKRDELEAELSGEEQRYRDIMSGTWYILIDGRPWRRQGQPVTFPGRAAARRAGQTIKNRAPEKTVTITMNPGVLDETKDRSPGKITKSEDPCWSGYHMVGTKKKGGREVPNCVPGKKGD